MPDLTAANHNLDVCPECAGTGDDDAGGLRCWRCHGHGDIRVWRDDEDDEDDEDGDDDG